MNIITNNCLGGFIYRDILKSEYQNPFIWTYIKTNEFIFLCENYNKINFHNYELGKKGNTKNNLFIKIDNKIDLDFHHIWFDETCLIPTIKESINGCDIHYNKPWEYIIEKYEKRLNRMDNKKFYFYFDNGLEDISNLEHLINICENQKVFGMIISHRIKYRDSKYVLQLSSEKEWLEPKSGGWAKPVVNFLGKNIKDYLEKNNEICSNNV